MEFNCRRCDNLWPHRHGLRGAAACWRARPGHVRAAQRLEARAQRAAEVVMLAHLWVSTPRLLYLDTSGTSLAYMCHLFS